MFQRKAKAPYAAATTLQQFRRVTSRYKAKGTFSSNIGYLRVRRAENGRFTQA